MAQRTKPPHMWDGVWFFSCEAVTKEPLTQSREFAAVAYVSSAFGDPEPDMDLEDEATEEAGIETLREAQGRLTRWSPNFNDENDRRFLAYLVKTGKFGGKPDLDVNSPIAGTEAIRHIHNWYIAKNHASWVQFANWLNRNDPEYKAAVAEEDNTEKEKKIKKEGKHIFGRDRSVSRSHGVQTCFTNGYSNEPSVSVPRDRGAKPAYTPIADLEEEPPHGLAMISTLNSKKHGE